MHVQIKDGRVELARKRQDIDLDVYGERRDSEQPKAANLSAWRIATVKKSARTNQRRARRARSKTKGTKKFLSRKTPVSALTRFIERRKATENTLMRCFLLPADDMKVVCPDPIAEIPFEISARAFQRLRASTKGEKLWQTRRFLTKSISTKTRCLRAGIICARI